MKGTKGLPWGIPRRVVAALPAASPEQEPTNNWLHQAPRRKKDTKRWCKGKLGREHKMKWVLYDDLKNNTYRRNGGLPIFSDWHVLVCEVCKKELDHNYSFGKRKKCPVPGCILKDKHKGPDLKRKPAGGSHG